jgi:NADPH:quinone reductase-like Zn-dependent oxidoreductase
VLLQKFGGPDELVVVERPVPEPGAGEVLVRVLAASVQYTDVILRKGRYPDLKEKPPLVLGYDLVGEVVKAGPGVTSPLVGQRVADLTMTGSYSQYRLLEADRVTVVDPALDPAEAASLVLTWTTAYQLLHRDAGVQRGQKLLVVGASGAVGQALVVLGKLAGCEVWGTARARHADLVQALGATAIDTDQADLARILPEGFNAVFDGIGEQGFSRTWRAVGRRGHLSAFGFTSAVQASASTAQLGLWFAKLWWWNEFSGGRSTSFFSITAMRKRHPGWYRADLDELFGMLKRGAIRPKVAERIGLDAVADAHARIERGGLEGKIVLVPLR